MRCALVRWEHCHSSPILNRTAAADLFVWWLRSAHPLLPAASELAYHTVNVSALNAEGAQQHAVRQPVALRARLSVRVLAPCRGRFFAELRREGGLEVVGEAFTRCIDVLGSKTTDTALPAQVCIHLTRLLAAAAAFDRCRERIIAQPRMVANVSRCLYIQVRPRPRRGGASATGRTWLTLGCK
mgnify:CR=1 FL=1